jgi:signal transduction histidine kinase
MDRFSTIKLARIHTAIDVVAFSIIAVLTVVLVDRAMKQQAYAGARTLSLQLAFSIVAIVIMTYIFQTLLHRRFLLSPLAMIRDKASEIAGSPERLGDQIPEPTGEELKDLARAFNDMSTELRIGRDRLEERVADRTRELEALNAVLVREAVVRKCMEESILHQSRLLRALSARLTRLEEAERKRLAEELHGQIGQNLAAMGMNLSIIRSRTDDRNDAILGTALGEAGSLLEQMTNRIRDIMADLRPFVLDDFGLMAAMRWFGEEFTSRTAVAFLVQGEEPQPRLASDVEISLFRIFQEAMANIAKHAHASVVRVCVIDDGGKCSLVIADNGIGFDVQDTIAGRTTSTWGLMMMKERLEALAGKLTIDSRPGAGKTVFLEVPRVSLDCVGRCAGAHVNAFPEEIDR